jgi:hypothetical protein
MHFALSTTCRLAALFPSLCEVRPALDLVSWFNLLSLPLLFIVVVYLFFLFLLHFFFLLVSVRLLFHCGVCCHHLTHNRHTDTHTQQHERRTCCCRAQRGGEASCSPLQLVSSTSPFLFFYHPGIHTKNTHIHTQTHTQLHHADDQGAFACVGWAWHCH